MKLNFNTDVAKDSYIFDVFINMDISYTVGGLRGGLVVSIKVLFLKSHTFKNVRFLSIIVMDKPH